MSENDKDSLSKPKNYYVTDFGIFIWRQIAKINQVPLIRTYSFSDIISSKKIQKAFLLTGIPLFLFLIVWKVPQSQVPNDPSISVQEKITLEDKARGTLIQVFGGLFFFVTAYFTWRNSEISHKQLIATEKNLELANSKQITERFSKAVEQLGNEDSITVRLGAIYSLERIAKDSSEDHWTIMEVLTAFVREKLNREKGENENLTSPSDNKVLRNFIENLICSGVNEWDSSEIIEGAYSHYKDKVPQDVQAALTVIGRRSIENESEEKRIDLSATNLNNSELFEANFDNANFNRAKLNSAGLIKAKLNNALLYGTEFNQAFLNSVELNGAKLNGAKLNKAKMKSAKLKNADLNTAQLFMAHLEEADFTDAYLTATILIRANFRGTNLTRADLSDANITEANFTNSDIQKTQITVEQILKAKNWDKAIYSPDFEGQLQVYLLTLIFRIYENINVLNSAFLKKIILNQLPIIT